MLNGWRRSIGPIADIRTTTIEETSFRWGRRGDENDILETVTQAFQLRPATGKWSQAGRLVHEEIDRFRVMVERDRIVGAAYLCRIPIQIGSACVDLGYIGQVSIRPECQLQGRGTSLIEDLLQCLAADDFQLARLSGLVRFYQRFGWTPFPRRFVEFPLQNLTAGMASIAVPALVKPSESSIGRVRDYLESDRERRDELVRRFNHLRTGAGAREAVGRSRPLHNEDPDRWRLVYESQGKILGYVATDVFPYDVSDFESAFNLFDVAFDLDHPPAVVDLIKHVLWSAYQRGARRVTARFPWDQRLFEILRDAGLVYEQVELINAATGNMLRIVSLDRLMERIEPELSNRWRTGGIQREGTLRLTVGGNVAYLQCNAAGVQLVSHRPDCCWSVELSPHNFLRLLLGLNAPETLLTACDREVRDVVRVLFPMQATASTNWG